MRLIGQIEGGYGQPGRMPRTAMPCSQSDDTDWPLSPAETAVDVTLLCGNAKDWPDRTLVVERQRNAGRTPTSSAIMTQQWRLVGHRKLFDIQKDPGQQKNVGAKHPKVVERLLKDSDAYWARVTPG